MMKLLGSSSKLTLHYSATFMVMLTHRGIIGKDFSMDMSQVPHQTTGIPYLPFK